MNSVLKEKRPEECPYDLGNEAPTVISACGNNGNLVSCIYVCMYLMLNSASSHLYNIFVYEPHGFKSTYFNK